VVVDTSKPIMVLIISNNSDLSTDDVIEYLDLYNLKWIRINEDEIVKLKFLVNDIIIETSDFRIRMSEIKSCWYRRGFINNEILVIKPTSENYIDSFNFKENYSLSSYFYFLLNKKKNLNNILNASVNKLCVIDNAKELGLNVPKSFIVDSKKEITKIKENLITKTISGDPLIKIEDKFVSLYTTRLEINNIPTNFAPSLVQEYITKKYELRIFYLNGDFYSMAIFSQNNTKTEVDFRKYDRVKPNRRVPYKLPKNIEIKLDKLMKETKLNCGSIDMIVTPKLDYFFLEVNPVGQFGMVSYPCNYNLESKIAKYLDFNEN